MRSFERELETPEVAIERWRQAAASTIDACISDRRVPADALLHFEHGRQLQVYADAPHVEGSVRPGRDELLGEIVQDFQAVAAEGAKSLRSN